MSRHAGISLVLHDTNRENAYFSGGPKEAEEGKGPPGDTPLPALPVQGGLQGGVPLWR